MSGSVDLATTAPHPPADAGERLAAEMAAAWARGERLPAEHYLGLDPGLLEQPEAAVRVIYEEVCLRQGLREPVSAEELRRRFPRWASELALMLDCHQLVQAHLGPPRFPAPGETLGDFRLIAELGRGMKARVFLATQPELADRPVVLKVTPRQDREFVSLARLQHTHIVPLHGAYDFPTRNLRALCLPYLGGATLARVLELLRATPPARRTGRSLVEALDRAGGDGPQSPPSQGAPREALARATYPEAVCWIGACLADALNHAHARGLVHLDIKPSNVLLAADGQPLLLDFHLAHHPFPAGGPAPGGLGGTPAYMSPEQRAAYAAGGAGRPVPAAVDGRSDIYSLGRLLYDSLGGAEPGEGGSLPGLRRRNPQVSVGLSDIIRRCLAAEPARRYPDAASLAADLRRHLADQPLRGVANRSLRERWRKWRRRRPAAPLWAGLFLALAALPLTLAVVAVERVGDAREALRDGQERLRARDYAEAARTLARGEARVEHLPGCGWLTRQFQAPLRAARRGVALGHLHTVCERLRLLGGGDVFTEGQLRTLEGHCRAAWEARGGLAGSSDAPLDEAVEEQAQADLTDLVLLWEDLGRRLAAHNPRMREAQAEMRKVLEEAEALLGPSAPLARERRLLDGYANTDAGPAARTPWEQVALARSLLRAGELDEAARQLERALERRPQDFWANFCSGACAYRRGRHADALAGFSAAAALAPEFAEVYHNRALAHAACGNVPAALRDYGRALALAPGLAASAVNRGLLHFREGRHAQAVADLESALEHGAEPAALHYNLALVHQAAGDDAAARRHLEQALRHDPRHAEASGMLKRLGGGR